MTLPNITATGNLGSDPELRFVNEKAVVDLSIGCNENKKDDAGNWQTISTVWVRVSLWEAEAESAAEHLKKGDAVTVTGQLLVREYEKKDGGGTGTSVEIKYPRVSKNLPRMQGGGGHQTSQVMRSSSTPAADPWGGGATNSEPPF